ncbi:unnamed protein product [Chrysoparadoxa australica]
MGGVVVAAFAGVLDQPDWVAMKWLAYGLIAIAAILLEITFKPAIMIYGEMGASGASPERDAALSKALKPVYWCVLGIYAFTMLAGISGLLKF